MRDHSLDMVLTQESGDASVVLGRRTLIVQPVPGHLDLLPTFNLAVDNVGHCDPLRAAPTVIDLSVTGHGHANDHVRRVLSWILARQVSQVRSLHDSTRSAYGCCCAVDCRITDALMSRIVLVSENRRDSGVVVFNGTLESDADLP